MPPAGSRPSDRRSPSDRRTWLSLPAVFGLLAGVLLLTFLLPLLAFLPDVDASELVRQVESAGLVRAVSISAVSASAATLFAALGGVPLGYLLARDRVPYPGLARTLVLLPLVLPPVAAGVLLLNVYGPGGWVGGWLEAAGWTVANALGGIVIAQVFIISPFVILTAEAAFRGVDPRLEAVAATLGRPPVIVFRRVSLPLARYGLLAGLALAWMRAVGEFGATVVLAYHPRSLPVHLWVELTGRGLRAALPVALVALALAAGILLLAQRFASRTRQPVAETGLRGPAREAADEPDLALDASVSSPTGPGPVIEADFHLGLGGFRLEVRLEARREILSLFGPSGAGKSTLLRAIAGLVDPDAGLLRLAGATVFGDGVRVPPESRSVGLVLQGPSLFPHLTVRDNVRFAADGAEAEDRFRRLLAVTRLQGLEGRYPAELSGGQQQRVALARALMQQPRILLLDEPFSSLDTNMRERLHRDVKRIRATFGLCVIYVTHELRDACAMGDRLAVIVDGRIEQVGEPLAVIRHPATFDVARFVGVRNLYRGVVRRSAGKAVEIGIGGFTLRATPAAGVADGSSVYACVRPEDFELTRVGSERRAVGANSLQVTIRDRQLRGPTVTLEAAVRGADPELRLEIEIPVRTYETLGLGLGDEAEVTVAPDAIHLIAVQRRQPPLASADGCDDDASRVVLRAERRAT